MDRRKSNLEKYNISRKRYKELCGFVEQYPEWVAMLEDLEPSVRAQNLDGMPHGQGGNTDAVSALAMKRARISEKIDLIDKTAKEAWPEFAGVLIKNVAYGLPFTYMEAMLQIPISRRAFSDRRRYFFFLLSQKRD